MLSSPWIKSRLVTLCGARAEFTGVSVLYGPPADNEELFGTRSDGLHAYAFFGDITENGIEGEIVFDEMCSDPHTGLVELYELPLVVRVLGKDTETSYAEADVLRADLMAAAIGAVAVDVTLDVVGTPDAAGHTTDCRLTPATVQSAVTRTREGTGSAPLAYAEGVVGFSVWAQITTTGA